MDNLALRAIFEEIIEGLPALVRQSIRDYRDKNRIIYRVEFNDNSLRLLEQTDKCQIAVAVNVLRAQIPKEPKWLFVFREYLVSAPEEVIKAIVQHELIHCFLKPYFFPDPKLKPALPLAWDEVSPEFHREIQEIIEDNWKEPASMLKREEELVCRLNLEWGCNEDLAREWLLNFPKAHLNATR